MEVKELVSLLKLRNSKGLEILIDNYSGSLNGVIVRIVRSPLVAEEILQNTYLKVWNNIDTYDSSKGTFYTWMNRIARNSALDVARTKAFNMHEKSDEFNNDVYKTGSETDTAPIDVENLTASLDEKYKIILDHIYLQGYSQSETAKKLDIPLGTVKTRLRFAVNELREKVKDEKALFLGLIAILITITVALWNW